MHQHFQFADLEEFKDWLSFSTRNSPEDVVLMLTPEEEGAKMWSHDDEKRLLVRVCLTFPFAVSAHALVRIQEALGLKQWAETEGHKIYFGQCHYILAGDA
jgi:hypothetical protein